jgi:catechol 2,3-dioxygenase-like lactoylglutathione lyase family enzyme
VTVLGLHLAGIFVSQLDRCIAFYGGVFGLELAEKLTLGAEKIAFVKLGSSRLELIEASGGPRPTGVVDHVALEVDDLDALLPRLRAHGVTLLDQVPLEVADLQARIVFCLGPDGERIELFEYDL